MRPCNPDTITDTFIACCEMSASPRLKFLLTKLATHLHAFAKEVVLTHEEWQAAMTLLDRAGQISSPERSEFILFSDVLGLSSLVDMINSGHGRTEYSNLGPFYTAGAQWLEIGGDLIGENAGDHVVFYGRVLNAANRKPVPGAVLELWQTASNGLYSNQDPQQPDGNLRCRMKTDANGGYAFTTIRPAPYSVPEDGPVGDLLRATGRRSWRPAHFHYMISAPGFRTLTTELFPDDDPFIDEDPVFGVREQLLVRLVKETDSSVIPYALAAANCLKQPFYRIHYDFLI